MRKHGPKILGLALVAAIGLMAFSASAALAVNLSLGDEFYSGEAGFILSGGVERPKGLTTETGTGRQIGSGRFLIPGKSAEIVCAEGELTGTGSNEYENFKTGTMSKGASGQGTALAKGCKIFKINPTTSALEGELIKCSEELNKASSPPGQHHITAAGLGFIKRHEGKTYGILVPAINSKVQAEEAEKLTLPYTTIKFGGTCSLPETVKITGSVVEVVPAADAATPKGSIDTFSAAGKALQELLGTKLKFGANEAYVQGEGEAELTGAGAGLAWGAM